MEPARKYRKRKWRSLWPGEEQGIKQTKEFVRKGIVPEVHLSSMIHHALAMEAIDRENGYYDAVHGPIIMSPLEWELHHAPAVLRLAHVKQFEASHGGFWITANNTRFQHSLGTMHLSGRLARQLKLSKQEQAELRIAGLLHDVGHAAFSHATEPFIKKHLGLDHEEIANELLRRQGVPEFLERNGIDYKRVLAKINGEGTGEILTEWADRIDYLQRDARFATGMRQIITALSRDLNKLASNLVLRDGKVCVREEAKPLAEKFARYRNYFFTTLYLHPSALMARELLTRAVDRGLREKKLSPKDLLLSDDQLVDKMLAGGIPEAKHFETGLIAHHFTPAFAIDFSSLNERGKLTVNDSKFKAVLERRLQEIAGKAEIVVAATPKFEKPFKYRLLHKDGRIENVAYAPTVADSDKVFLVACSDQKKADEMRKTVKEFMQPYLTEENPLQIRITTRWRLPVAEMRE
ncbi:HD domain-containing protein [Candidatus Micrarchaeota archaeon]|nr:HD domain-containing protein [Candidatus Micrarchaeota archaeon]